MLYRLLLITIITFLSTLEPAQAENDRYRVEILVLTHLGHDQQPREVTRLEDFSTALDFLLPPEAEDSASTEQAEPETPGTESVDIGAEPAGPGEESPDAVVHVAEMGPEMQDAWRRLRLSGPFRPLQYLAWEQGSDPPFPTLRVHDAEAILVEDPWAAQRLAQTMAGGSSPDAFGATVVSDSIPAAPGEGDDVLPEPIVYYRLDGTARLTRSRFLHLAVAIEWREPFFDSTQPVIATATLGPDGVPTEPVPAGFLVQRLEQSRSIRTGRMEYFDGPVLGVLAWISKVSDEPDPALVE